MASPVQKGIKFGFHAHLEGISSALQEIIRRASNIPNLPLILKVSNKNIIPVRNPQKAAPIVVLKGLKFIIVANGSNM